jgi:hypothetical protein
MSSFDDPILNDLKVRIASLWDCGIKFIWFKINNMEYSILSSCLGYPVKEISDIIKFTNLSRQPDRVATTLIWGQLLGFETEQWQFYNKKLSEKELWIRFTDKVLIGSTRAIGRKRNLSPEKMRMLLSLKEHVITLMINGTNMELVISPLNFTW